MAKNTMDEMLEAVNDYVLKFAEPATSQERIYRGKQNRAALPDKAQDFVIIDQGSSPQRIGTNSGESDVGEDGTINIKSLRRYPIDIDFCHVDENVAHERAAIMETLGRSAYSVEFFEKHGFCFLYADDLQPLPYVDEFKQYIHRYRVTVHLTRWSAVSIKHDYFEDVQLGRFENVDVHHPPTNGNKI